MVDETRAGSRVAEWRFAWYDSVVRGARTRDFVSALFGGHRVEFPGLSMQLAITMTYGFPSSLPVLPCYHGFERSP